VSCKSKKNCGGNSVFYTAFADKNGCSLPYASAKKTEKQPPLSRGNPELFGEEGELPHKYNFKAI
jgi:hypothetical protein